MITGACTHTHTHAHTRAHTCTRTRMLATIGPPQSKAGGLDSECHESSDRTFWQSRDSSQASEGAWRGGGRVRTRGRLMSRGGWGGRELDPRGALAYTEEATCPCVARTICGVGRGSQGRGRREGRELSRGSKGPGSSEQ